MHMWDCFCLRLFQDITYCQPGSLLDCCQERDENNRVVVMYREVERRQGNRQIGGADEVVPLVFERKGNLKKASDYFTW